MLLKTHEARQWRQLTQPPLAAPLPLPLLLPALLLPAAAGPLQQLLGGQGPRHGGAEALALLQQAPALAAGVQGLQGQKVPPLRRTWQGQLQAQALALQRARCQLQSRAAAQAQQQRRGGGALQ